MLVCAGLHTGGNAKKRNELVIEKTLGVHGCKT